MKNIPKEILLAGENLESYGDYARIKHKFKNDGSVCSLYKEPACVVTKYAQTCVWHCFRCEERGNFSLTNISPNKTIEMINRHKKLNIKPASSILQIPKDFINLCTANNNVIPPEAFNWVYKYGLSDDVLMKFGFGWSKIYNRVIIPIFEYAQLGNSTATKLLGWVGREVHCKNKKERIEKNITKYITKKLPEQKHIYFHAPKQVTVPLFTKVSVVVEDIISAIKINDFLGCETFAILNNKIPISLPLQNKNKFYIIWLDHDQMKNMQDAVIKYTSWGFKMKYLWTQVDPKAYSESNILKYLKRTIHRYYNNDIYKS